jgi:hypothetical protein
MIKTFKCPNCGATMSYEGGPEATLTCAFCGSVAPVPPELRVQAQADPVHGFATHTPHPHAPADAPPVITQHSQFGPRRVRVDWQTMNPAVRTWIIIVILIFVIPNCIGLAIGGLSFVMAFVGVFLSVLAEVFAR